MQVLIVVLRAREHRDRDRQALSPSRRSRPACLRAAAGAPGSGVAVEDRARDLPRSSTAAARRGPAARARAPAKPSIRPGGRLTASWASEATTCTRPVARASSAVRRRTVEPKRAGQRARGDCTSTPASTRRCSRSGRAGRPGSARGGRAARGARARAGRAPAARSRRRRRERALDQQVGAAAERQRAQRRVVEVGEPPHRDLAARQHLERDLRRRQLGPQRLAARPRRVAASMPRSSVDVRRREDRPRARRDRRAGQLERPRASAGRRRCPGGCGSAGRSRAGSLMIAHHVRLDRGGHGRIRDGGQGGPQAIELARQVGRLGRASCPPTSRCPGQRLREEARAGADGPAVDGQPARGRRRDARGGGRARSRARASRSRPSPARATRPTRSSTSPRSASADLIVVGNKGMTGAKRFLLGSVPNKVSHHAPCSC